MDNPQQREEELFALALAKPIGERAAFLDGACHGDPALRVRLNNLLASHEQSDGLNPAPVDPDGPTLKIELSEEPGEEAVGTTIGRYKLLQKLGEGGCGAVYVAEQQKPVRRRVALKLIKLGMDTKAVVARFEAERQALALMDHPNIAKVLDAGSTESGRPYFVMELVRGIKITDYCDKNKLSTEERLHLFIKVCHAIQHAHQKGIIHRDIKPSNILITLHDGIPIPMVIDFGIAKATEGRLTDATVYTQLHQFIGTPAYMSPEQAEMSGLDVDTRSDIYSLGVLLYELLTGQTPFDPKVLTAHGIDAMRRFIREEEPQRPSTRLSTMVGDELTATASRRAVDPPHLAHLLRGDLDWIVMKCLEKDRTRRYETANGLAMDLERYLHNELVVARPPSRFYRFQKTVRRNKLAFTAVAAVAIALLLSVTASTWLAIRAKQASRKAETAALQEEKERQEAESRTAMTRALSQFAEHDQAGAETNVLSLPNEYVQQEADTLWTLIRALGHWNGGAKRWQQCAACYDMILLGPASRITRLPNIPKVGWVSGQEQLDETLKPSPLDLAYLEYAPVLVELGEKKRYEELCDAAVTRYHDIDRTETNTDSVNDCGERLLHACLLMPVQPRHRVAFCKWAALVGRVDPPRVHHNSVLALFEFRRGHFQDALVQADKALTNSAGPAFEARAHVVKAMAYAGLNEGEAAQTELGLAHKLVDPKFEGELGAGHYGSLWADWLIDKVLLKEAERLARMPSAPSTSTSVATPPAGPTWEEAMARARQELAEATPTSAEGVARTSQ